MADVLGALILPSNVCFGLVILGLALSVRARTRRAALITLVAAGALLVIFSSGKTATALLGPLESAYPRAPHEPVPVEAIVVLTAYVANDPDMSLSDRPNPSSLYRVTEAALLWRHCADCVVIVSGRAPATDVMSEMLIALGVPRSRLQLENESGSTGDSAVNVARLLGDQRFYLVTSAGHMPRTMAAFAKAGMQPLPAPTDHRLPRTVEQAQWRLSAFHLECSDLAMHERVGMCWYRLRGRI
jgi:uncharacterized SAM-binding protein YcdF (DUF218 family)